MRVEKSFVRNLGGLMPPAAALSGRASRGSSKERSPAGRHEESDDCIVPRKPRTKPSDIGGGDGGGKAVGRRMGKWLRMSRTQSRNRHVTEAARPRIGAAWAAQAPMADHVRPSTGARCVSSARRDLCGGERGNLPPTATIPAVGVRLPRTPETTSQLCEFEYAAAKA
jgi:hypothetical protein